MKKYTIEKKNGELFVGIDSSGLKNTQLLEAFQRCREGRCDCHTDEYDKLDSMQIKHDMDRISLQLKVKPGLNIDQIALADCLDYTLKKSKDND